VIGSVLLLLCASAFASASADETPDPGALIKRLGAASFDDRVAAYKALERLGGDALPALRAAADASDPRVRSRVRALLEALGRQAEVDRVSRPTMVRLDFRGRPLGEIVDALNHRHDLNLDLQVGPAPRRGMVLFDPKARDRLVQLRGRSLTLEAPGLVPFWEAVDRLCQAAALHYDLSPRSGSGIGQGSFTLRADRTGRGPVSDFGPVRVEFARIYSVFERDFTGDPDADPDLARPEAVPAGAGELTVSLAVLPEPGLVLHQTGPLTVVEAVDNRGRSLSPRAPKGPFPGPQSQLVVGGMSGYAGFRANLELVAPDPPGASIRRLRGNVPVVAVARGAGPLVIPLTGEGVVGKPFWTRDMTFVVDQTSLDPGAKVSVVVTVRTDRGFPPVSGRPDARRADFTPFWLDRVAEHLELVDANGRRLQLSVGSQTQGLVGTERFVRYTLVVRSSSNGGPAGGGNGSKTPVPAELRYYDFVQTAVEVPFDFRDLPMP
jgi:hypothetical protein